MNQYPNIPPFIENDQQEYYDSGVPSKVAVAGHPLHPLIVTFPIAFLVGVLGTDIGYWLTRDIFWARASVLLLVAGLLTGLLAAITGMIDFLEIDRVRQHNAGWIHMIGNIIALVLSGISLFFRWEQPGDFILFTGLILSLIVASVLGLTGWFGAELVYRHKVAVIGNGIQQRP
ncbi:DUF2231 domain-containing protein [Limnoraphis robusta]|uniref:DUF2231 domain-containing protein n=1 Tax=Limnoraphis robusta CCNP1315 TaxID=3110306 RepID=A0ABU5TWJ2_9CYAN|nr:DUF2231 domain-containing protein [Limnoraphis robusta]MEA5519160.1 DUF2231 domain-containing protein [Limnoraphis robusta CCNP1315]MEA5547000.1 DUF2231 domain-containing protein [Limnoraphis robusta CCNP1324]